MLCKEIQILVDTTLWKARRIIHTLEEELHTLVGYAIEVSNPKCKEGLTEWEYDCPAAPDVYWKSVKEDIQDIVMYTQQLGMAREFHSEAIKLQLEVVTKYYLWHSLYSFQENDLELSTYINKELRKPTIPINQEPHWVLQNWDDIMGFMMCGTHLDREVHPAGDVLNLVQQGIGS